MKQNQMTFSDVEYSQRKKITKKEKFLREMDAIIPWERWVELIRPYYPTGKRGRPPRGIELMLRMYLLQDWFNLSDEGIEDAVYDTYSFQRFLGINFLEEQVPDATTLLNFRHLLEEHNICKEIFDDVNRRLDEAGLMMHGGTIVDATIIAAPSSVKNAKGERDPEMHQTKKGNQWHHGMKVHAGVDAGSGYVHTITGTAANVSDVVETSNLLREDDNVCYGDSGYTGAAKREEIAGNENFSDIEFRINLKPSRIKMPVHMECFDNSNIQGTNPVASCVVFRNGVPSKKDYRKFKIKTVIGANDFASMKEVVNRRYSRMLAEAPDDLPQLIVIDGGKGQLDAAYQALSELHLTDRLTVVGLAKRLEEVIRVGDPYPLFIDRNSQALKVLQQIRDEAHRFGITFHRDLRSKSQIHSALRDISGVGEKTEQRLLMHFGSVARISAASEEELSSLVGPGLAARIKQQLDDTD